MKETNVNSSLFFHRSILNFLFSTLMINVAMQHNLFLLVIFPIFKNPWRFLSSSRSNMRLWSTWRQTKTSVDLNEWQKTKPHLITGIIRMEQRKETFFWFVDDAGWARFYFNLVRLNGNYLESCNRKRMIWVSFLNVNTYFLLIFVHSNRLDSNRIFKTKWVSWLSFINRNEDDWNFLIRLRWIVPITRTRSCIKPKRCNVDFFRTEWERFSGSATSYLTKKAFWELYAVWMKVNYGEKLTVSVSSDNSLNALLHHLKKYRDLLSNMRAKWTISEFVV